MSKSMKQCFLQLPDFSEKRLIFRATKKHINNFVSLSLPVVSVVVTRSFHKSFTSTAQEGRRAACIFNFDLRYAHKKRARRTRPVRFFETINNTYSGLKTGLERRTT